MTNLAEAFEVDPELADSGLASLLGVFRLRIRSHSFGRLAFLVTDRVGSETALSAFCGGQSDERSKIKLFTHHWKPDFAKLKE